MASEAPPAHLEEKAKIAKDTNDSHTESCIIINDVDIDEFHR